MNVDYARLFRFARRSATEFAAAKPFPHLIVADFLDGESYEYALAAFPHPDDDVWKTPANAHTVGKSVVRAGPDGVRELTYAPEFRRVMHEFNSGAMIRFLELLTGIEGLIPDPSLAEAGAHQSGNGGRLDIHADFSHHDHTGLERRVNLIWFLNRDWEPEWGGGLMLCAADLQTGENALPLGNRAVVFATSDISYHGHPTPMNLPAGVYRRSLAMYYYTVPTGRAPKRILFPADPSFVHEATP